MAKEIFNKKMVKFVANAKNLQVNLRYTDKLPFKIFNIRLKCRINCYKIEKFAANAFL